LAWNLFFPRQNRVETVPQSARVWGLVFFAVILATPVEAQAAARVEVLATVVSVEPARSALASMRWLLAQKRDVRKERGLATIVVSREKRRVRIDYLKN